MLRGGGRAVDFVQTLRAHSGRATNIPHGRRHHIALTLSLAHEHSSLSSLHFSLRHTPIHTKIERACHALVVNSLVVGEEDLHNLIALKERGEVVTERVRLLATRAVVDRLRRVVRPLAAVAALVAVERLVVVALLAARVRALGRGVALARRVLVRLAALALWCGRLWRAGRLRWGGRRRRGWWGRRLGR